MTISIISNNKNFDQYMMARSFFASKGITYKLCGPYTREHEISFNLPLVNTDSGFYKTQVPLYSYKSDISNWLLDMTEQSGSKTRLPQYGLVILLGEEGEKLKSYLKSYSYNEVLSRVSIISDSSDFKNELEKVWDKFQIYWTNQLNKRSA